MEKINKNIVIGLCKAVKVKIRVKEYKVGYVATVRKAKSKSMICFSEKTLREDLIKLVLDTYNRLGV